MLFSSNGGFPTSNELFTPQKLLYGHAFFAGLLYAGEMDESVDKGDLEESLVVGDDGPDGKLGLTGFDFGGKDLHLYGFTLFG